MVEEGVLKRQIVRQVQYQEQGRVTGWVEQDDEGPEQQPARHREYLTAIRTNRSRRKRPIWTHLGKPFYNATWLYVVTKARNFTLEASSPIPSNTCMTPFSSGRSGEQHIETRSRYALASST